MGMDRFGRRHIEVGLSTVALLLHHQKKKKRKSTIANEGEDMFRMNYVNEVMNENLSFELNCVGMQQCVFINCFDLLYDPNI